MQRPLSCTRLLDVSYTLLHDWCNSVLSRLLGTSTTDISTIALMYRLAKILAHLVFVPNGIYLRIGARGGAVG